ncbi:hypothetical protein A9Q99_24440 [Gammaproteobacteria bacterium 45_16_T64]|nr:hypothetical protein A9Q99_24440 [Gammaproteobacteria bacterium 45_16_T64]
MNEIADPIKSLPDIQSLSPESALTSSIWIRSNLRPKLLKDFTAQFDATPTSKIRSTQLDRITSQIDQLDHYAATLDQRIFDNSPPTPAQHWKAEYSVLQKQGNDFISAESPLFFSAESLTNVHGPVMLFHLATLAEELLLTGEHIISLRKAIFKKLVTNEMSLFVCDAAKGFPDSIADKIKQSSISGKFALNSGRVLNFIGVAIPNKPVTRFAHFNSFTMNLMPPGLEVTQQHHLFRLQLESKVTALDIPRGGFSPASSLMTMLDIWMIMILSTPTESKTRLLLSINKLDILPDPERQLISGVSAEVIMDTSRSRALPGGLHMVPTKMRFSPIDDNWSLAQIAAGGQPYYHFANR